MGLKLPKAEPPPPHPTVDRSSRFLFDTRLRRHGFCIHARPRDAEPVWRRQGRLYTQAQALAIVAGELREVER